MNDLAGANSWKPLSRKNLFGMRKKRSWLTTSVQFWKRWPNARGKRQFEELYAVDASYRDVGKKMDDYYSGQRGS